MATLSDMHDAITSALQTALPVLETVRAYGVGDSMNTPAALLELETVEEGEDDGSGRIPLRCTWTIHCILSHRTPKVEREVRDFATQVFGIVRRNRWGLPTEYPEVLQCGPGEFQPGQEGYESWYVTWEQPFFAGEDVWTGDGIQPDTVYSVHEGEQTEVTA